MALNKSVKIGGAFYKGFELLVSDTPGDYILDMTLDANCVVNSISFTCDVYGAGDTMTLKHLNTANKSVGLIAESIYNPGAGITIAFDFPALEPMQPNEPLRLTYTNAAGKAIAIHTIVEYGGITKE